MYDSIHLEGKLEFPNGVADFALTDANHVSISGDAITINGVTYRHHIHLYIQPDGSWNIKDYHDAYGSRPGSFDGFTISARKKYIEVMREAWQKFVTDELRLEAEIKHREHEFKNKVEERDDAKAKLNNLEYDVLALAQQLEVLKTQGLPKGK